MTDEIIKQYIAQQEDADETFRIEGEWLKPASAGAIPALAGGLFNQELKYRYIVILDNLSVHKNSFDTKKFFFRNIEMKYLPTCSQNLNPIVENME